MKPETILHEKAEKYYCTFDEIQTKAIIEAMELYKMIYFNKRIYVNLENDFIEYLHKLIVLFFNLKSDFNIMKTRKRAIVESRYIMMYFIKKYTKKNLEQIGSYFGKDHSTVLHGVKKINNLIGNDKKVKENVEALEKLITKKIENEKL